MTKLEKYSRHGNLIISGLNETVVNLQEWFDTVLCPDLDLTKTGPEEGATAKPIIKPDKIHRLGKEPKKRPSSPATQPRGRKVIIRFQNHSDRDRVWEAKSKQKGYWIEEHLPESMEKARKQLYSMATIARKKGYQKASVRDDYLWIGGERYYDKDLIHLPENLQDAAHHCFITKNQVSFLGFRCPLSNFYPCTFTHNDETYTSSEQLIQRVKAEMFPDNEALIGQIMSNHDVQRIKFLGTKVNNFDEKIWKERAMANIQPGLLKKFEQNPKCLDFLKMTGNKLIVEANGSDRLFGIGQGFNSITLNDPATHGSGSNIQGKMLTNIRSVLCE
ncbi:MAG: NADAR family protein [Proteobacteria bacterium]|nr:NADAR family protein [Pseudomonadota bacterium]